MWAAGEAGVLLSGVIEIGVLPMEGVLVGLSDRGVVVSSNSGGESCGVLMLKGGGMAMPWCDGCCCCSVGCWVLTGSKWQV